MANDPQIRGRFHYDTAQNSDAKWAEVIENVQAKTGHFLIHPGQFGLKGSVVAHMPLGVGSEQLKEIMLEAKRIHQGKEKPKHYREHLAQAREHGISFSNNINVGVDKDGDGEVDRVRGAAGRERRRGKN